MSEPTQQELIESVQALTAYHDRLRREVVNMSQKLRLSPTQIKSSLDKHHELNQINEILSKLKNSIN